jgi:hypothetical protein
MPIPVYDDVLTRASQSHLGSLVKGLPQPVAICGGHAVRLVVEKEWKREFGERYFGSRDIDIVYFVDINWTRKQLAESPAGLAPNKIRDLGYQASGAFRFERVLDADGNEIQGRPSAGLEGVDFHVLYIDPLVTRLHPKIRDIMGFVPADEPLIEPVFTDARMRLPHAGLPRNVLLPVPGLLIATKLWHLPERTKDDKAIKDLSDLFALVQYSPSSLGEIRSVVGGCLQNVPELVQKATTHELLDRAVRHLGVSKADFRAAVGPLAIA